MDASDTTLLFLDLPRNMLSIQPGKYVDAIHMAKLMPDGFPEVKGRWESSQNWVFSLPEDRILIGSWIEKIALESIHSSEFLKGLIVGFSWEDVWEIGSPYREYAFRADVQAYINNEDGMIFSIAEKIRLADLDANHKIISNTIYPPIIIDGWPVPTFNLIETKSIHKNYSKESENILILIDSAIELIVTSNSLSDNNKRDLCGYLKSAKSILEMNSVDASFLKEAANRTLSLAKKIGFVAGEKILSELIDLIIGSFF